MANIQANRKLGVPHASAGGLGAIVVYISQMEAVGKDLGQILIYLSPAISVLSAAFFAELEIQCKDFLRGRKTKSKYRKLIKECDSALDDKHLDQDHRNQISATRNKAKLAIIANHFEEFSSHLSSNMKPVLSARRRVNKTSVKPEPN
jgi:hypothetical protein